MKTTPLETFGAKTFDKKRMKERLPYPAYLKWKKAIRQEEALDKETSYMIAHAMKEWAIEEGATHYCHWFQPLNGLTAKKHESFLDRGQDMEPMVRFSGKELIQGEPDASSFPSGGMRSTFEARGYTYWDCTANSFIIDNVLYIPSIFVSYRGDCLDKRGPLLRSMDFISREGSRVVNLFKREHAYRLRTKLGLEQEFFLVDKTLYEKRKDLVHTGRTLIGAPSPKGQELEDHYFGAIPERVMAFYRDLNEELLEIGIYAKTEHNEVAPCQFEVAILFENSNVAIDDNQLVMEILKKVAGRHGLSCLLHEKPFAKVNGSGKHNNWSVVTNYGLNCLEPGENPRENMVFLLFVAAVIEAVDRYQDLLRVVSSNVQNDHRLGADEAPPAILSIYLGDDIENIFLEIEDGVERNRETREMNIRNLGYTPFDDRDRNRTSPFAFTGNKFEFRMLGSSKSAADVNIVLNTTVGESLRKMAECLEKVPSEKREETARGLIREIMKDHGRILFGGDNYSKEWAEEAKKRGLSNYATYLEALVASHRKELVEVFAEHEILRLEEMEALYDIFLDETLNHHYLEARAMASLIRKDVLPSIRAELSSLHEFEAHFSKKIGFLLDTHRELEALVEKLEGLSEHLEGLSKEKEALVLEKNLRPIFAQIRALSDAAEIQISRENWKIPSYEDLFTSIL